MSTACNSGDSTPMQSGVELPGMRDRVEEASTASGSSEMGAPQKILGGLLLPFKIRDFNLLFGGQTISTIGDALYAVALPWLILTNGGSAQELGIVLTAYGIPRVGSILLGGWLSDRLRPRRVMLIADAARAILVGLLALLALWGHPTVLQLCAIAALLGALGGMFLPASMAMLPNILNDDALQAGNSAFLSSMQGANLVGSALAGVIVATLAAGAGLTIDAATFLVSAASLALMRSVQPAARVAKADEEGREQSSEDQSVPDVQIDFWRFLRTSRLIQVILGMNIVAGFCVGGLLEVALPTLVHGPMHGSASNYGIILAAWGAGALGGGILAGTLGKLKHKGLIMLADGLVMGISLAVLPFGGLVSAIACMLIGGIANSITSVLFFTVVQRAIPRHLMGRVMGLLMLSSSGMYPLSVAVAGVLSNQFGPAILFPFCGLLLALVMLFGMTQRVFREI